SEIEADGEHTAECTDSSEQFFWKAPRFSVQSGSVGVGGDHVEPRAVDAALPQRVKRRGVRFEDVRGQLPVVELNAVNRIARHLARRTTRRTPSRRPTRRCRAATLPQTPSQSLPRIPTAGRQRGTAAGTE